MDPEQIRAAADVARTGIAAYKALAERAARQRATEKAEAEHRVAIKAKLEEALGPARENSAQELVVIDAARPDLYPEPDPAFRIRSISPWFKVEGWSFYGNGLEVGLAMQRVAVRKNVGRIARRDGEWMIVHGRIPFANLIEIDSRGDSFTGLPLLYCHFDRGHEPYESFRLIPLEGGRPLPGVKMKKGFQLRYLLHLPGDLSLHRKMVRDQKRFDREIEARLRNGGATK